VAEARGGQAADTWYDKKARRSVVIAVVPPAVALEVVGIDEVRPVEEVGLVGVARVVAVVGIAVAMPAVAVPGGVGGARGERSGPDHHSGGKRDGELADHAGHSFHADVLVDIR